MKQVTKEMGKLEGESLKILTRIVLQKKQYEANLQKLKEMEQKKPEE
jgi:hypothetical protein